MIMTQCLLNKKSVWTKSFFCLLLVLDILFVVYWVFLSMNYCLHYDDVHFMWKMKEYSIFEYVKEMYITRGGNFVGYAMNGIIFTVANWFGDYHLLPLIYYVVGIMVLYYSVKGLVENVDDWKLALGVVTFYNVYVLTVPDYSIFTWLCAMGYYWYAPMMCLLIRMLNKEKLSVLKWVLVIVLVLLLSGSNVTITPMVWLLMFVNIMVICRKNKWNIRNAWNCVIVRRMAYIFVGMFVVYSIMFMAPGNFSRLEDGTDMDHPSSLSEFVVAWIKCVVMFFYFMAFYFPYHFIVIVLGFMVGTKVRYKMENKLKVIVVVAAAFMVYLAIATLPLAYLSNGFGIQRNYTHITFFYMLMWALIGVVIGNENEKRESEATLSGILVSLFLCVVMSFNLYCDIPLTKQYKKAHDERKNMLNTLQKQGNKEMVCVEPYPSTRTIDAKYFVLKLFGKSTNRQTIFYESDAGLAPNEYEGHVKHLLGLDFDFVLCEKENE